MPKRRFEFNDANSEKFWEVETKGVSLTVTFGRLGAVGQSKSKEFDSKQEATASADKLINQKVRKGYREIDPSEGSCKTSRRPKKRVIAKRKATVRKSSNAFWEKLTKRELESRPTVTPKLIKSREKSLGIHFPASLIKLLREQNGGYLSDPEFIVGGKTWNLESIPPICETWGIESLEAGYPDHLELATGNLPQPDLIFPLCGDGHWFIALDYRRSGAQNEPEVIYLDIESRVCTEKIAKTFEGFLKGQQTGEQGLDVRFDEIDPKTIIGEVDLQTKHKAGHCAITYQAKLCLTSTQVILYAHETWDNPPTDSWWKHIVDLKVIDQDWVRVEKNRGHFTARTSTLFVYSDRKSRPAVVGLECDRTERGWKNLPCEMNHLSFESRDAGLLEKCRSKILKAFKSLKR